MILNKIATQKLKRIEEAKRALPISVLKDKLLKLEIRRRNFKRAITEFSHTNIIAEVKKASPSKGIICKNFDYLKIAHYYEFANASAISVLTEEDFFQGKKHYLKEIRDVTKRPLLRKDFILDEYQLYESVLIGADAVLLIAALLSEEEINDFIDILKEYKIDALVEVHTFEELQKVLKTKAEIIGINNRNLYNFEVNIETTVELIREIPHNKIVVSESGIRNRQDIQKLKSIGVKAFLVGESLLKEEGDIVENLSNLIGWS